MKECKLSHADQKVAFLDITPHLTLFLNLGGMKSFLDQYHCPTSSLTMTDFPVSRFVVVVSRHGATFKSCGLQWQSFGLRNGLAISCKRKSCQKMAE
jgi:hypothetical protein